ncbi:MAG TPA: hypothetical protein VFP50_05805 [Anaeromyxobacteraceae bacterium]|nr:hypothetical protein [Anaeromyxobacteraceae bacterium]
MHPRARPLFGALILAVLALPATGEAEFNCEHSVSYQAGWCSNSLITSIRPAEGTAVCGDFTRRLEARCRPDWDRFRSCADFARRFEDLLVEACVARKVARKHCQSWGAAFTEGTLARCRRGRVTF